MKSSFTITKTPAGHYLLDARGAFGGGHVGQAGKTPQDAANYLMGAIARYGQNNKEGYTITAPPEVLALLPAMTLTEPGHPQDKAGRKTVVFTGDNLAWLAGYRQPEEGPSMVVNAKLNRYREAVKQAMPIFSLGEWSAIMDANNGAWLLDTTPTWLSANVADAPEMAEKWNIDHGRLVDRMYQLTWFEAMAVEDVIERFWKSPNLNSSDTETLLLEAGARVAE